MARFAKALLVVALLAGTAGCSYIGLPDSVTVKSSEFPGTWQAACGETMVLQTDGSATATGFRLVNGQRSQASEATWKLSSHTDDPHLWMTIGNEIWDMDLTREKGQLRAVNEADGATCIFIRG